MVPALARLLCFLDLILVINLFNLTFYSWLQCLVLITFYGASGGILSACCVITCLYYDFHINHAFNLGIFYGNVHIMLAAKLKEFCIDNF